MKYFLLLLSTVCYSYFYAQTILDFEEVDTFSQAVSGDLYKDEFDNYYLGMDDGRLVAFGRIIITGDEQENQVLRWNNSLEKWIPADLRAVREIVLPISSNGTVEFDCPSGNFTNIFAQIPVFDNFYTPRGTFDPGNLSTLDDNLINGNKGDLVYNNRSAGTTNKALPAVDLGEVLPVAFVRIYWYSQTYGANEFIIQGSRAGNNWDDLTAPIATTSENIQDVSIRGDYRHIRLFCLNGRDNNWIVVSEMEIYGASANAQNELILGHPDFKIIDSPNGKVAVENNGSLDVQVKVFCQD